MKRLRAWYGNALTIKSRQQLAVESLTYFSAQHSFRIKTMESAVYREEPRVIFHKL